MLKMIANKKYIVIGLLVLFLIIPTMAAAESIIRKWEGKRLKAYQDSVGIWTIGFGSTYNYDEKRKVKEFDTINEATAVAWLNIHTDKIRSFLKKKIKVPVTDNELAAIVSLVYNIGEGNFADSTLLRLLNKGADKKEVAKQFSRWNKIKVNGVYVVSDGLVNRRKEETILFLK